MPKREVPFAKGLDLKLTSPESESTSGKNVLRLPTLDDVERIEGKKLHAVWRENHKMLQQYLVDVNPPYFGLHGTSQDSFRSISQARTSELEVATFSKKEYDSPEFMYQLYQAALYTFDYATYDKRNNGELEIPGRILILNLENDNQNAAHPWEKLKPKTMIEFCFNFDSPKERAAFKKLGHQENLFDRSEIIINNSIPSSARRLVGSVDLSKSALAQSTKQEDLGKKIISYRFMAQEIVQQALQLFE